MTPTYEPEWWRKFVAWVILDRALYGDWLALWRIYGHIPTDKETK